MMTKYMRAKFEKMEVLFIHWTFLTQVLHIRVNALTKLFGCVALPAIPFHPSPCSWVSSSQTHLPFNHYLCSLNCLRVPLSKEVKEVIDERLTHGEQFWRYSRWYTMKCYTAYSGNCIWWMQWVVRKRTLVSTWPLDWGWVCKPEKDS